MFTREEWLKTSRRQLLASVRWAVRKHYTNIGYPPQEVERVLKDVEKQMRGMPQCDLASLAQQWYAIVYATRQEVG